MKTHRIILEVSDDVLQTILAALRKEGANAWAGDGHDAGAPARRRQGKRPPIDKVIAERRKRIVEAWDEATVKASSGMRGKNRDATRQFLAKLQAETGVKVSLSTLYRWSEAYRRDGIDGLMDGNIDRRPPRSLPKAETARPPTATAGGPACRPQAAAGLRDLRSEHAGWISLAEAARRSGLSRGYLRGACCRRYAAAGLARKAKDDRGWLTWQVSEAADPRFEPDSTADRAGFEAASTGRQRGN